MIRRRVLGLAAAATFAPAVGLWAQAQVDLQAGRWEFGEQAYVFQIRSSGKLFGPLSHGISLLATVNDSLGRRRAFYGLGYDFMLFRPKKFGPYGVAGVALGLSTDSGPHQLAAQWTAGAGWEWKPLSFFGIGVEARYRMEDRGPKGFWNATDTREGVSVTAGAVLRWRNAPRTRSASGTPQQTTVVAAPTPPGGIPMYVPLSASRLVSAPTNVSGPAGSVVNTAIGALGTPYRWGGTEENGFDCSGLVQWAYGQHGVQLPRMSRAQASAGTEVPPVVDALVPGDILLFAEQAGAGVTHVGLYVGERKFIHSGSNGVRIALLDHSDANGSYWLQRWVGARRIVR